jgi:predicted AAA+ superfamily ATPase
MDLLEINTCLLSEHWNLAGVLPHLDHLQDMPVIFTPTFGLDTLPTEPGILMIRGSRQYGKSTWLEQQIALTIQTFGIGTALYLNGDEIKNATEFLSILRNFIPLFPKNAPVKRLFIDEITAIAHWETAIKRLVDSGELNNILLITTGSKATDLRRGIERLPGRKGKLSRTQYIFTPIAYSEFKHKCVNHFQQNTLLAYLLCGGSPVAANALIETQRIPEYVTAIMYDGILGEFSASGRSRAHLLAVLQNLYRMAGTPMGQAKLARESGLSNNTVAQGYIDLLVDLMMIIPVFPYDADRELTCFRKPCKYHFTNLLAAFAWHPKKPRTITDLQNLGDALGVVYEWAIAQELWRRACITQADHMPEYLNFWHSKTHEIDFVLPEKQQYFEIKLGKSNAVEFLWFLKSFHQETLTVINTQTFDSERIIGITMENFLLQGL